MRQTSWRLVRASSYAALSMLSALAGCGSESPLASSDAEAADVAALEGARAPKIARVTASGAGCAKLDPEAIAISGTRDTFRIKFDDFEVESDRSQSSSTECTVAVLLEGVDGIAYAPSGLDLAVETRSGAATVVTSGSWAGAPDVVTDDTQKFPANGRHLAGTLDDDTLWSSCSGERELRFTTKLSLDDNQGRAEVRRLSDLHFYVRPCQTAPDAATPDASTGTPGPDAATPADAGIADATTPAPDAGSGSNDAGSPDADPQVTISSVTVVGDGCPEGSAPYLVNGGDLEVDFKQFTAETTPERTRRTIDCTVSVQYVAPAGKTLALRSVDVRGSATVPAQTSATLALYYSHNGQRGGPTTSKNFNLANGPFDVTVAYAESELLFKECGRNRSLEIQTALSVNSAAGSEGPRASLDRLSKVRFALRDCP